MWFFSSELWNILMMGSILWFGTFSLTLLNLTLYLTLIPQGIGGEIAPLFMVQTIKSGNWDIWSFFYEYRILSVSLHEKNSSDKFWQFFLQIFYENWFFWILNFLRFCPLFCSQARYLSMQYLIFCIWMSAICWINFVLIAKKVNL